jgi:hypothetical protein
MDSESCYFLSVECTAHNFQDNFAENTSKNIFAKHRVQTADPCAAAAQDKPVEATTATPELDAATALKEEGNRLLTSGDNQQAFSTYALALAKCNTALSKKNIDPDTAKTMESLRVACLLNAAMAAVKLENWHDAVAMSSRAISLGGESAKALYRRATALINLGDSESFPTHCT